MIGLELNAAAANNDVQITRVDRRRRHRGFTWLRRRACRSDAGRPAHGRCRVSKSQQLFTAAGQTVHSPRNRGLERRG